jgi:MoxR-like ATPase
MSVPERLAASRAEIANLAALFHVTPKKSRHEVVKATMKAIASARRSLQEAVEVEPKELELPLECAVPTLPSLPPMDNIFSGIVWGENKTAFVELEYLINEMRMDGTTYRFGLFGPPSAGKTLTAGRIARGLDRRYMEGNASFLSEYTNPIQGLVTLISRLHDDNPVIDRYLHDDGRTVVEVLGPTVFFVDEAHEMPISVQNTLLPITEKPYRVHFGTGYLDFRHVMFIFGTTDPSHLLKPLRTRLKDINFVGYSVDSVAQMVKMHNPDLSMEDALLLARAGKLYPRRALSMATSCSKLAARYGSIKKVLTDHLGIDEDGLDPTDRRILDALAASKVVRNPDAVTRAKLTLEMLEAGARLTSNQIINAKTVLAGATIYSPMGRQALADKIMSTDSRDIMERVGYLEQLGKVQQSSRGVQLTG